MSDETLSAVLKSIREHRRDLAAASQVANVDVESLRDEQLLLEGPPPLATADVNPDGDGTGPVSAHEINLTTTQFRNRSVVDAQSRGGGNAGKGLAAQPNEGPVRLRNGSTACCNRTRCPGAHRCYWVHPELHPNLDQFAERYTNSDNYGAERAQFTRAVVDAYRAGRPIPTLTDFRRSHAHLIGTSSHELPFNPRVNFVSADAEVNMVFTDGYPGEPLGDEFEPSH